MNLRDEILEAANNAGYDVESGFDGNTKWATIDVGDNGHSIELVFEDDILVRIDIFQDIKEVVTNQIKLT